MESSTAISLQESELFLQWGNRKRNRCARAATTNNNSNKDKLSISHRSNNTNNFMLRPSPFHSITVKPSKLISRSRMKSTSSSPENDTNNHYITRRASLGVAHCKDHSSSSSSIKKNKINNNNTSAAAAVGVNGSVRVWPKLYLGLSNKEKEEDFMAMKGCKPPHRPKKRPKAIQRSVLMVCPGGWLADMCEERYEVREKKSSKKRPRGLKAMGSLHSDSDSDSDS